jgi:hypothetical protein
LALVHCPPVIPMLPPAPPPTSTAHTSQTAEVSRLPTGPNRDRLQAVVEVAVRAEEAAGQAGAPLAGVVPPALVLEHQCQAGFNALCRALVTPGVVVPDLELGPRARGTGFLDPSGLAAALQYSQGLTRLRWVACMGLCARGGVGGLGLWSLVHSLLRVSG